MFFVKTTTYCIKTSSTPLAASVFCKDYNIVYQNIQYAISSFPMYRWYVCVCACVFVCVCVYGVMWYVCAWNYMCYTSVICVVYM